MIYLDNAATGGFKPNSVIENAETVMKYLSANPGRSGHRLSVTGAEIVYNCRKVLADLFSGTPERVIFTKNCTEGLNLAIFGTVKQGGHVITTVYEHNSVLRPLFYLQKKGLITLDVISPDENGDIVSAIEKKITPYTYLIVCTAISNVTGKVLPIKKIGALSKTYGIYFLCDGAQAGGHIPLSLKDDNIDMLALAGHKGLYGIMGSGALVFSNKVEIEPLIMGGTGTESFNTEQPSCYPERLESGTLNLPAIAALYEGTLYVKKNLSTFSERLFSLTKSVIEKLSDVKNLKIYSEPNPAGIVALNFSAFPSSYVADILNDEFDIAVRAGLHCAPLMHKYLKTDKDGLVRISIAPQNTSRELLALIRAVTNISFR